MHVITRSGIKEPIKFDKITERIESLCFELNMDYIDPILISQKVIEGIFDGITTQRLDQLAAETAAYLGPQHPDYALLAGRIAVSNLHKETNPSFFETLKKLYTKSNPPIIDEEVFNTALRNKELLDQTVLPESDFKYDYFGFKTLEKSYLLKLDNQVIERPGQMLMRVSLGIHKDNIPEAIKTYQLMSDQFFTHASPTLFNSGTSRPQLSSCFLLTMKDDSIEGIYQTLAKTALISQSAGGIGLSVHNIRAKGTFIKGTNGNSNGLVPMLKVFNDTARYVDQGGGKRKGAFAIYLEPWHSDVFDFLELKKNTGKEELRARDLFYALWVPDLFMKRVKEDKDWSLFCPHEAPNLSDCYGKEFEELYLKYEKEGRAKKTIKAQKLWFSILETQIETGSPYILYKDSINEKSNQKNLGTIKSSNLCTEIMEYTSSDEVAVCNLASLALPKYVKKDSASNSLFFDHQKLFEVTYQVTKNLNKIIDINYYPVPEAEKSNKRHRPIGLGVQGLADTFFKLRLPFESKEAKELNRDIFETLYYAACKSSIDQAKKEGHYPSFKGSPASKGLLQFDLWGETPQTDRWDWKSLKQDLKLYGMRNSLLVAPMPTASTAQIFGNTECFEPITSNLYVRRVLSGEFAIWNRSLVNDLIMGGFWTDSIRNQIMKANGSIQSIKEIPSELKEMYKTIWEIKQKHIIDMARARAPFIDQGQSMNIYMESPNFAKLSSMHFYTWESGLKTGMYYLRSRAAVNPVQFTVNKKLKEEAPSPEAVCNLESPEDCISCGS